MIECRCEGAKRPKQSQALARVLFIIIFISSLIAATGCAKEERRPAIAPETKKSVEKSVFINDTKITLSILKSDFSQKEIVPLRLRLTNTSDKKLVLNFPSSQKFDFAARDKDGNEVWRWSADMSFAQAVTKIEIKPGEHQDFFAKIDAGVLRPGSYEIEGTSTAEEMFNEKLTLDISVK